ncbi:MAG: helix-turn-helix domain-containing protein [Chloroflexota bacterium]
MLVSVADNFGSLLKFLRLQAHLTQRDLAAAVGYTEAHICRLEKNERLPDLTTVAALFIPALDIKNDPAMMERLLKLAAQAREERSPSGIRIQQVTIKHEVEQELGALENVPARLLNEVPRPALVERTADALQAERCVALCGLAGTGKTILAASVARPHRGGPVFWHTFTEGVTTSAEAILRQLALFFFSQGEQAMKGLVELGRDAAPMAVDQQLTLVRAALANHPSLLCFEDVHLLLGNEASLSVLRQLTTTTPASILLTSRMELPLPVMHIPVGGLEVDEARELARRLSLDLEADALDRLFSHTGRNPMLLKLAAGQLLGAKESAASFLEHLATQPQVASYLLDTVLHDLSPAARWLASFLSIFRQPVNLFDDALAGLLPDADPHVDLASAGMELQRRYLIENFKNVILHPLVREYLYAWLGTNAPLKKQLHRLAAEWSEDAAGEIVEAAHHWVRSGELEQASEIIGAHSEELFQLGKAEAAVQVTEEALARLSRKRGDITDVKRNLLNARGDLLRGTFRTREAEASYREALSLAQGRPAVRAQIVRNLAQNVMQRGQVSEGVRLCQSALKDLSPADIVLRARLAAIESRGHLALSHYEEAEQIAREAIALADQFAEALPQVADDVYARCERTLGWLSYTRHPEGDESLVHYRRALECSRRAGLRLTECAVLSNTATALTERGDMDGARRTYEEALRGYESIGDMYGAASILHNLGALLGTGEDYEASLSYFEKASEIEQRIGDREGLLSTDSGRASILMSLGRLNEARDILDHALILGKESTDTWTLGTCLCLSAEVYLLQGELKSALGFAQRVLSMPGIEDNARIRIWASSDMGLIHLAAGDLSAAGSFVAMPPPEDLGFELTSRLWLVQSAAALAGGDVAGARRLAKTLLDEAVKKKLKQLTQTTERLLADPPPPIAELPRLILMGN